jgi:hypothetical protein
MRTQQFVHQGLIRGELSATTWIFHAAEDPLTTLEVAPTWSATTTNTACFEAAARPAAP